MVYINECLDANTAFFKILQIYELFTQDPTVSKEFPKLASPRLYLDIFFQIYAPGLTCNNVIVYKRLSGTKTLAYFHEEENTFLTLTLVNV